MNLKIEIAAYLKSKLDEKGISSEDLAKKILNRKGNPVSRQYVDQLLAGDGMSLPAIEKICKAAGFDYKYYVEPIKTEEDEI